MNFFGVYKPCLHPRKPHRSRWVWMLESCLSGPSPLIAFQHLRFTNGKGYAKKLGTQDRGFKITPNGTGIHYRNPNVVGTTKGRRLVKRENPFVTQNNLK